MPTPTPDERGPERDFSLVRRLISGICLLLLSPLLAARQPDVPEPEQEEWPRYWTAADVRRLRPGVLDVARSHCRLDQGSRFLTVNILGRRDEVVSAVHEAMKVYGFVPLPEYPGMTSENKHLLPDDVYSCYYSWHGLGSNKMIFAQYNRILPEDLRAFGPPRAWFPGAFYQLLMLRLSANGLSRLARIDEARYRKFRDEHGGRLGPGRD